MNIFTAVAETTSQPAPKSLEQVRSHEKTGSLGTSEQVTSHRAWEYSGDERTGAVQAFEVEIRAESMTRQDYPHCTQARALASVGG